MAVLVSSLAAAGLARRMPRFSLLTCLSAGLLAAMAALAWNPQGLAGPGGLAFIAAQSFYVAAMTIYESCLPDLVPAAVRQKLSGLGWAIGYLGGIAGIAVLLGAELGAAAGAPRLHGVLGAVRHWRTNRGVFRLLLLAFGSGPWMPLVTVIVIGCCLGATFSGLRGFLAESIGNANPVAFFALATAAGRIAAGLAPALFSLAMLAGGEQVALLFMLGVFACGGLILLTTIPREPSAAAKPDPVS